MTTTESTITLPWMVSVDDHAVEPKTLWSDRLPSKYLNIGPRVIREEVPSFMNPGTKVWCDVWYYEDQRLEFTRGFASAGMAQDHVDFEPMTFDEMRKGCYDVPARLADMDYDGVEASVCFPNIFVRFCGQRFLDGKDKELALLCVQAYNDWIIEEWAGTSDGRLVAVGVIPLWDVALAVEEVKRNAARGCKAVCFSEVPGKLGLPSMYGGYWEPFFTACEETGTVINVHVGSSSDVSTTSEDAPMAIRIANFYGNQSLSLSDWLLCGVFERHPNLKVAFSEGQAGWVPFLMSRLDGFWKEGYGLWRAKSETSGLVAQLPKPPSEYLKDHVYLCIFDDPSILRHLDLVGEDNLCFETDYPHPDGSFPKSRESAHAQTDSLDEALREKILRTNGAKLYGIERILSPR